jgi:opacity protein-like surface antigen
MKTSRLLPLLLVLIGAVVPPAAAQSRFVSPAEADAFSIRAVGFASGQQFAAETTFNAVFGESFYPFFGGGFVIGDRGAFLEVAISRFRRTGQRAFLFNGQPFGLNIPLTTTITPVELSGGYRFRRRTSIIPYAGVGIGSYGYKETSDFAEPDEDVDVRHVGYLVVGGAEFRVHRWVGIAADVHYTHVPGILGTAGLSKDAGEDDLGGTAIRIKVLVGTGR